MNGGTYALDANFKDANGKSLATYTSGDAGYYLRSTSEDIVQIAAGDEVTAVNVGAAVILLCYTDDAGKEQVTKAFPIEVKEANKATANVTATLDKNSLNIFNFTADDDDAVTLSVKVLDLDNKAYDSANLTIEVKQVDNNATSVGLAIPTINKAGMTNTNNEFTVPFDMSNVTPNAVANATFTTSGIGRVTFCVTVKEGSTTLATKNLSFVVANIDPANPTAGLNAGTVVGWRVNASKSALDISRKDFDADNTNITSSKVTVQKTATKSGSQFYLGTDTCTVIKSTGDIPITNGLATASSVNYLVVNSPYTESATTLVPNTGDIFAWNAQNISVPSLHDITVKNFVGKDSNDVAKAGTYSFTGVRVNYETDDTANSGEFKQKGSRISLGTVSVVVSGTDAQASYVEKADLTANQLELLLTGTAPFDVSAAYKVTWDGLTSDDTTPRVAVVIKDGNYKIDNTTDSVYVYKITAIMNPYSNGTMEFSQDITVNKLYKDK